VVKRKITALITGYDGFVGPYLAEHLLANGRGVFGTVYVNTKSLPPHQKRLKNKVTTLPLELTDYESVKAVIEESKPNEVYHLAAISHIPTSWKNPHLTFSVNVIGSLNLLCALREARREVRFLAVSSAEVYGSPLADELPVTESAPLCPENPYAASKAAFDLLAYQWSRFPGMHIVRVRPFPHTGPGQSTDFVCPSFARQIAQISLGLAPPVIKVGNLSARRDFTDVRDVVRAYALALESGKNGEVYNVCSAKSHSIKGILRTLKSFCPKKIKVEIDPTRLRPGDTSDMRGSFAKLRKATGWRPRIPFTTTLRDLYQYRVVQLKTAK